MNWNKKKMLLPQNRIYHLLTPMTIRNDITARDDKKGTYFLLSNGTGYSDLSKVFRTAGMLKKDELIFYPFNFSYNVGLANYFVNTSKHYTGIVLFNYCTTQTSAKDILSILKTKSVSEETIGIKSPNNDEYPEHWETRRRLTVKKSGSLLILSGNKDIFTMLAYSCSYLSEYGDDAKYNYRAPHRHHDMDENTAKSIGITFYYWHHGEQNGS